MKRTVLIVMISVVSIAGYCQQSSNEDEATLVAINRQFIKNFLNNDTIAHSRIIHPNDFLFIGKDGILRNRNEYMSGWAHGYDKDLIPEFDLEEVQVRIFGDMALIVAKTKDKTMKDGKWVIGKTRYTDTYFREKGEWKCVQVQLTRIADQNGTSE